MTQDELVKVEIEEPETSNNKPNQKPNTTSKPVKTGDEAPILPLIIMGLGAALVVSKKR